MENVNKSSIIEKNRTLPTSRDYHQLRALGLKHIEELASGLWTDYNLHDPGITILETLCYAITDLGYRCSLDIADILARDSEDINRETGEPYKDFLTAAEILTCNPVTHIDLRKVIIDCPGVQNGWLYSTCAEPKETTFYYGCYDDEDDEGGFQISMDGKNPKGEKGKDPSREYRKKALNGLYNVLLQLEEDDRFGDLNANVLEWPLDGDKVKVVVPLPEVQYPSWNYPFARIKQPSDSAVSDEYPSPDYVNPADLESCKVTDYQSKTGHILFKLDFTFKGGTLRFTSQLKLLIPKTMGTSVKENIVRDTFERVTDDSFAQYYLQRLQRILGIFRDVYCALHRYRSLCEDVFKLAIVPSQEIGICADIRVSPEADNEEVMARILFEVDRFLAPPVKFYSLKEMQDKGKSSEEIFDGHIMDHGFIDNSELALSDLVQVIRVSDIYRIIMKTEKIPGVVGVTDLLVTNYLDGVAQTMGEPWCLRLDKPYHLNLSLDKSRILFYKEELPFRADKNQVLRLVQNHKSQHGKPKITNLLEKDFPPPKGEYKDLQQYYSIQNDFPLVYGIGADGLSPGSPPVRKAQAKQLKAFLMFFDQLLANYLAQLADVKNQFSVDYKQNSNNGFSYAVQPLYRKSDDPAREDFPDLENLYKDFIDTLRPDTDYDNFDSIKADWNRFVEKNENKKKLHETTEGDQGYLDRRNRFLDHLIARFGESFTDYALLLYDMSDKKQAAAQLIEDKEDFLAQYPVISRDRGKGFLYKPCFEGLCDIWFSANVSGLKNRLCKLLGINDARRKPMGYDWADLLTYFTFTGSENNKTFHFSIDGAIVLSSSKTYTEPRDAEADIRSLLELSLEEENYTLLSDHDFQVRDKGGKILAAHGSGFPNEEDARTVIREFIKFLADTFFMEGMHIIEHILLRPVDNREVSAKEAEEGYFRECFDTRDCRCPVHDHYSFRISVILPYWPVRFRNMNFREYAEKIIHRETPAHILPRICWIAPNAMKEFEDAYKTWLMESALLEPDKKSLDTAIHELIKALARLTSVYPTTRLNHCTKEGNDNAVILDKTILGTFEEDES